MDTGLSDILAVGLPVVGLGTALLFLMVYRELGPFAGLSSGGRWLLTAAFGLGIFAFGLKMAVAVAVDRLPGPLSERLPGPAGAAKVETDGAAAFVALTEVPDHYVWQALPASAPAPADNPGTPAKVELGKRLFFERRLSADGSLACASCHDLLAGAGADGRRTALGIGGQRGARNVPTVWNAAFQSVLFWDGRAASLEQQAQGPILNPLEMGMPSGAEAVRRIAADPAYREAFECAFGPGQTVTFERIAAAIAAYERTLITPDSPYDRFVRGDEHALDPRQLRGMALFESLGCVNCHKGPSFSDASLVGGMSPLRLFPASPTAEVRRFGLDADSGGGPPGSRPGIWRVPSLRNVALTAPYFHNGSVDRLADAVRIMAGAQLGIAVRGVADSSAAAPGAVVWAAAEKRIAEVPRRSIGEREVEDLVAFLGALSGDALAAQAGPRRGQP